MVTFIRWGLKYFNGINITKRKTRVTLWLTGSSACRQYDRALQMTDTTPALFWRRIAQYKRTAQQPYSIDVNKTDLGVSLPSARRTASAGAGAAAAGAAAAAAAAAAGAGAGAAGAGATFGTVAPLPTACPRRVAGALTTAASGELAGDPTIRGQVADC